MISVLRRPSSRSPNRLVIVLAAIAATAVGAAPASPVLAQTLGDLECRRVAMLEFEAVEPTMKQILTLGSSPAGMFSLGMFGPAFVTEVSGEGAIAIEPEEVRGTQIGGTPPQRTCRIRARVRITYSRAALEPDPRPDTTTTTIRRPVSEVLVTDLAYDMTFAGAGDNLELIDTELGELLIQTLALDAKAKNEAVVTREMQQAIAEKAALIHRREVEARRAEFEAREAQNRRMQEHYREREEQRQREEQASRERVDRAYAEEARRRNAEQQAREQAHERMLRLERLRGYLASAEDRLSRLTRPNDRADQQRRVDEIRAQIAREEGR